MALSRAIFVAALAASEAAKASWDGQHGTDPEPTVPFHDKSFNKFPHEKTFGNLKDLKKDEEPTVEDHFSKRFPQAQPNEDFKDDFVSDDDADDGQWYINHNYDELRMQYGEELATKDALNKKVHKAKEEVDTFKPVLMKEKKRVVKVEKQLQKLEKAKDAAATKAAKIFDKKNYEAEKAEAEDEMEEQETLLRGTEKQQKADKEAVEKEKKNVQKAEDSVDADLKKKMKEAAEKFEDAKKDEKESKKEVDTLQGQLKDAKKHANDAVKVLEEEEIKFKEAEELLRKFRNGEIPQEGQSLMLESAEAAPAEPVPEKGAFRSWLSAHWPF